ncbi:DUF2637 domain-containing protein [Streptomyces sp. SID3915]|uniref:DUF2637 domain-containing protein n=1 Tax=Streptomyces sp. SID3915 TaxID=2690263 RepID=UPI001370B7C3|nr:DUF2637 domain-containing protein [Streptomyces sp. SID3915]MYX75082.1 DUF2637 domain-containing protein [Streptomyces sp. SID3915]
MKLSTEAQVAAAERVLKLSWVIVFGAVLFSVLTVTPLVQRVTPDRWDWTAPILPIVVDAAVIIVVRIDAIIARLGGRPGGWSAALRWLTGGLTLALNIGDSALKGDMVGVGVHVVAPILLITTAEATLTYRRSITAAVERITRERAAEADERKREQREQEERSRAEREAERAAQEASEQAARDAEREAREQAAADREREREHAARLAREEREHAARIERERAEREDARAAAERAETARREREERERQDQLAREQRERDDRERKAKEAAAMASAAAMRRPAPVSVSAAVSTPRPTVSAPVSTPAHESAHAAPAKASAGKKMTEEAALVALAEAVREGRSQRQIAALTGWSTGWVAKRVSELEGASR